MRGRFVAIVSYEGKEELFYQSSFARRDRNTRFVGRTEETPIFQLIKENGEWKIGNYDRNHTVKILPMFSILNKLPLEPFNQSFSFNIHTHKLCIRKILAKGGEGIIYEGIMDNKEVVFKMYMKRSMVLRYLPSILSKYCPKKYLLFLAGDYYVIVMERLYSPVYSTKLLKESLEFLSIMKETNETHGDISPGNVMMDSSGSVKFIDFSRGVFNGGTPFYSKDHNDSVSLSLVLLGLKYSKWIKDYMKNSKVEEVREVNDLPSYRYTLNLLFKVYQKENGNVTKDMFFKWIDKELPEDEEKKILMGMLM